MVANTHPYRALALLFFSAGLAFPQTPTNINLQSQSRNPDFSTFPFTRPVTVGTSLPASCQVGQLFFNSAAAAGSNLYACTAQNVWTLESATSGGGSGSSSPTAWSAIAAASANLSLSMGAYATQFSFGSTTGAADMFKWTDSASNTGTGALGHFSTASGSSAIPWQADANGVGWRINASGQLQGVGSSNAGMISFPQGSAPGPFPANSVSLYAPASIATAYQWVLPPADAAGALVSDGNGTPGHLSLVGFTGTGNIIRGGIGVQQAGSALGTVTTVNCGSNVTCTVNSGVATIASSGGGGGGGGAATSVVDSNQNPVLQAGTTAAAVDQITITNAATGGTVSIAASGTDSNIPVTLQGKGTGQLNLNSTSAHIDNAGNLTVSSCNGCGSGTAYKAAFSGSFGGAIAASTTQYGPLNGAMKNSTESSVQEPNPVTGTLKQLTACIASAQPSTGSAVFTLRKAGASTAVTVTIPASAAAGCYTDNSDTAASNQGDLLSIQVANNATSATGNISFSVLEQ